MKCSLPELVGTRQTNPKCSKEERELKSRSRVRFSWSQAIPLASPTRELRPIRQYQLKVDGQSHIKGNERKVNEDAWRQVKEDESVSRCRKDRTPKAIQKCSPPMPVFCRCCCSTPWMPSYLVSLSLCTTPPGRSWPADLFLTSGAQVSAILAMLFPALRRTCPILFISVFLSSQTVTEYWSACTVPHLRFGLARKLSVFLSGISCETHPGCSCLQLWFSISLPHTVRWLLH